MTRKELAYKQEMDKLDYTSAQIAGAQARTNAINNPRTPATYSPTTPQGKNFKAQWPNAAGFSEELERGGRTDLIGMLSKWFEGEDDGTDYKELRGWFAEKKLDFPETYPYGA